MEEVVDEALGFYGGVGVVVLGERGGQGDVVEFLLAVMEFLGWVGLVLCIIILFFFYYHLLYYTSLILKKSKFGGTVGV